jgi:hypothetical protein
VAAFAAAPPLAVHIQTGEATFQLLLLPAIVGADNFVLQLMTGEAALLKETEATLSLGLLRTGALPPARKAAQGVGCDWHCLRRAKSPRRAVGPCGSGPRGCCETITLTDEFEVLPQ